MPSMRTAAVSFVKSIKAGVMVGFLAAGANNVWSFCAQLMGSEAPPGFALSVAVSSLLLCVAAALLYYLLLKTWRKGHQAFVAVVMVLVLASLYAPFGVQQFADGTPVGEGFALLTVPMHLITGVLGIKVIPKFSR